MAPSGHALRVLVIDDELLIRWSIAEALTQQGHYVVEAADASGARNVMSAGERIDVVLLDYRLPDSNDLRLLEEVRRRMPDSAVVLMTAYGTPELTQGALHLGAYRVLSKPFDMQDVEPLVRSAHEAAQRH